MDESINKIDLWRHLLHTSINNNKNLNSGVVLELSQKLDKVIVDVYKKQPSFNKNK
ncbi:hypothetical protein CLPUN_36880 [Clostridium puniceum]|uniref:Spo0E like sporulation regulatory protein n=1 Tax=Clostridium puniceum TaxID=29367 RepID=A0A1S8TAJ1_9CLOT|nr:aspartyl-phosphate phosphatase Spo0E family protein [Clostridium puniceum]OOM74766.1 hypothetical protein CLPUN_36880 [Clostridium puniceum]